MAHTVVQAKFVSQQKTTIGIMYVFVSVKDQSNGGIFDI